MFDTYQGIYELAKPYLQTRYNEVHIEIAYSFARRLLETEPGDREIIFPAVICHDLGWIKLTEDLQKKAFGPEFDPDLRRIHEVEGAKLARLVLNQVGYDPNKIEEIVTIIDGHDSRLYALSDNDKIVKDADKLWRYTDIGITIDMERFGKEPSVYIPYLKEQIDPWFFTETSKLLARNELAERAASFL